MTEETWTKKQRHLDNSTAELSKPGDFVEMIRCNQPDCNDEIGVTWHVCDQKGCTKKFKKASTLKQHKADVHNIGVTWHVCDQKGCTKKFKQAGNLKQHKADVHNIGVTWHECDQEGCTEKFKQASNLKQHKAYVHDIGVTWHVCDQKGCTKKFKKASTLKKHKAYVHDIGTNECECCCKNRNSKNTYWCPTTKETITMCNACFNKATGKHTRKEKDWSDHLDEHLGTHGLLSSDRNLRSLGGCQLYRPDKLYTDLNYVEQGECDEDQHLYANGTYECDERRVSDIYGEDGIVGKNMCVLRWNPDHYVPKKGMKKIRKEERLQVYVKLARHLRKKKDHVDKIHIYYLFYSEDNPRLSKNIPHTMIHSLDEICKI